MYSSLGVCVCGHTHRNLCISDIKKKLFKCKRNTLATATAADKENRKNPSKSFLSWKHHRNKKNWRIGGWKIYGRKREERSGIPAGMQQPNERKLSAALGIWQRLWRRICNHHADFHKQPASSESKANRKPTEDTSTWANTSYTGGKYGRFLINHFRKSSEISKGICITKAEKKRCLLKLGMLFFVNIKYF